MRKNKYTVPGIPRVPPSPPEDKRCNALFLAIACSFALTGCVEHWTERLRQKCEKDARTVVYDRALWDKYREIIMENRRHNPAGAWTLSDYKSGFEFELIYPRRSSRALYDGEISRFDKKYSFNGKDAFSFIVYGFGYSTITNYESNDCLILTPDLYLERF